MLDFARIALRAAGRDYAEADGREDEMNMTLADIQLRHAAVLYVYEALRACITNIKPKLDEMLNKLVYLAREL